MNRLPSTSPLPVPSIEEPRRVDQGPDWQRWRDELAMGLHDEPISTPAANAERGRRRTRQQPVAAG